MLICREPYGGGVAGTRDLPPWTGDGGVGVQSTAVGVQRYSFATKRRLEVHGVPDRHEGVGGEIVVQGTGLGVQCYSAPFV